MLRKIFLWWNDATIGALFDIGRRGQFIGDDDYGNRYFEDREASLEGRKRRWVTYRGYTDASRVPPDWHGWLHYTFDDPPTYAPLKAKAWEKPHSPNLTGTLWAYRPQGSLAGTGKRAASASDYEAWQPETDPGTPPQ